MRNHEVEDALDDEDDIDWMRHDLLCDIPYYDGHQNPKDTPRMRSLCQL